MENTKDLVSGAGGGRPPGGGWARESFAERRARSPLASSPQPGAAGPLPAAGERVPARPGGSQRVGSADSSGALGREAAAPSVCKPAASPRRPRSPKRFVISCRHERLGGRVDARPPERPCVSSERFCCGAWCESVGLFVRAHPQGGYVRTCRGLKRWHGWDNWAPGGDVRREGRSVGRSCRGQGRPGAAGTSALRERANPRVFVQARAMDTYVQTRTRVEIG